MAEKNTIIKLKNVSKRFNVYRRNIERIKGVLLNREPVEVKHALNDISFDVEPGERIAIMGKTDSGRTTLLKVISQITTPSKGKVKTNGELNVMLDARAGMDMEFTCRDNIYAKANVVGLKKEEVEPYVNKILEMASCTHFADVPMKRAPKGCWSIISLGVHLIKKADIIICDEVFTGGGNIVASKCEDILNEYLEENPDVTAIMVTNRMRGIRGVAERTIILSEGDIVFDGDIEEAAKIFRKMNTVVRC